MSPRLFSSPREEPQQPHPFDALPTRVIRDAEDGSEILYGLARALEAAGAQESYVEQVRTAAHAVREITNLHDEHKDDEEDSVFGAREHVTEIGKWLRPKRSS